MYSAAKPSFDMVDSREFIAQLTEEAKNHRALNHPIFSALVEGDFFRPDVALKDFAFQYLAYSTDFLRYLTATIAQLDERPHREMLLHNLMEEAGKVDDDDAPALHEAGIKLEWIQGVPHPELYQRFLKSVGVDEKFRAKTPYCDEALIWRKMFLSVCSTGGAAQALGAMGLGTENIVKFVYQPLIKAIQKHLDVTPEQRVFFDLHAAVDDEHGEVIDNIAAEYAQYRRNREPLRNGMLMALNARAAFFDGMLLRAQKIKSVGQIVSPFEKSPGQSKKKAS
jgi:pyrroloquinoline quinone (PQQ) biosynthesis protein C